MMSLFDVSELFEILFLILGIAMFWHFALRPVLLDIVKASLFRLRDQLRTWYISLSVESKKTQEFSYLFMERAINCVADSVGEVSVWRSMYRKNDSALDSENSQKLKKQIVKFMKEKDEAINSIDEQHSLLFGLLLLINSPLAFILTIFYGLLQVVRGAAKAENFASPVNERIDLFRGASHRQVSCI